ncbi:MAG: DnaD domain protein [Bacilli bacterium]|nr:DnaD domain protein [Bacilli bacterium]
MNNYSKLIRSNVISLNEALIQNYKSLGLDEINMTLLLLLNFQKIHQDDLLSTSNLALKMTLDENEISKRILDLLQKGYIELNIDETKETFSLDPLIDKIGDVLAKTEEKETIDVNIVSEIIAYCEQVYQRTLSVEDLNIINMWAEKGYSIEEIKSAVLDSLKAKKMNLRYADAIIVNRKNNASREKAEIDPELQAVLSRINVKRNF